MEENKKDIWFPAKKYGYGWGLPITWQGWLVMICYILLSVLGGVGLSYYAMALVVFIPYILLLTCLFILICWKKGEKAEWRWGDKK
jgi:hypothetical protein